MNVYKRGDAWWYGFNFAGRVYQESTKSKSKTLAKEAEKKRRRELEEAFNDTGDKRKARVQTIKHLGSRVPGRLQGPAQRGHVRGICPWPRHPAAG
jgi:hypothetical protein